MTNIRQIVIPFIVCCAVCGSAQSAEREKLAEGRYQELANGVPSRSTEHSWVLLRTGVGYELEDHFSDPSQAAARLMMAMGADSRLPMTPDSRQEAESLAIVDDLAVDTDADWRVQNLVLKGKQLNGRSTQTVTVLECKNSAAETKCRGLKGNPKLKNKGSHDLFYSFSFPMLFAPFIRQSKCVVEQPETHSLATLSFDSHERPQIAESKGEVKYMGQDDLQIVDKTFHVGKYEIRVRGKDGTSAEYMVWASSDGLVLAVETANNPGTRSMLVSYKRYSNF